MKLFELITVSAKSNDNLISRSNARTLILPYDVEMISSNGQKALHKAGTRVYFSQINSQGNGFKVRLWRTLFSTILSFDNKKEFEEDGFVIE